MATLVITHVHHSVQLQGPPATRLLSRRILNSPVELILEGFEACEIISHVLSNLQYSIR